MPLKSVEIVNLSESNRRYVNQSCDSKSLLGCNNAQAGPWKLSYIQDVHSTYIVLLVNSSGQLAVTSYECDGRQSRKGLFIGTWQELLRPI